MPDGGTGFQPVKDFKITRRNLPHWEDPGSVYFITFRSIKHFNLLDQAKTAVLDCIKFHDGRKYQLYACVVLIDHVHLILSPLQKAEKAYFSLSEIMHSIKSYSAKQVNKLMDRSGTVWLDENFDRIIRDEGELEEKMNYVSNNALRVAGIEEPEDYKWLHIGGQDNQEVH